MLYNKLKAAYKGGFTLLLKWLKLSGRGENVY